MATEMNEVIFKRTILNCLTNLSRHSVQRGVRKMSTGPSTETVVEERDTRAAEESIMRPSHESTMENIKKNAK